MIAPNRKTIGVLVLAAALLFSGPARGGDDPFLDVKGWLLRPGGRLLVVELYAPWCKPCKKAEPKWEALHGELRSRGLRVVVVIEPSEGSCASLNWVPDKVFCDYGNKIAGQLNIDELPQAFLWSWQGMKLVGPGTVDEVISHVEEYFEQAPRILVSDPTDGKGKSPEGGESLKRLVRSELARMGKFELVADKVAEEELRKLRKQGYESRKEAKGRCKLGKEVSPNTRLEIFHEKSAGREMLILELFSVENGCLVGSARAPVLHDDLEAAVLDAVGQLVWALGGSASVPGSSHYGGVQDVDVGQHPEEWKMGATKRAVVRFESEPSGAAVLVGGRLVCPQTPCSRTVPTGIGTVEMQMERYLPTTRNVQVKKGMEPVRWRLEPDFAWLTVHSAPAGMPVLLDGKELGTTPIDKRAVDVGSSVVELNSPKYFPHKVKLELARGKVAVVDLKLTPRLGGLQIDARDNNGNDIVAEVFVDGKRVGETPFSDEVLIGEHRIQVVAGKARWSDTREIVEKKVTTVVADMPLASGSPEPAIGKKGGKGSGKGGRTAGWVFVGSTVVFGGLGGILWWSGKNDMDEVRAGRKGNMDQAAAADLESKANLKQTIAVASFVVGGISVIGAAVSFATSPKKEKRTAFDKYVPTFAPIPGGGGMFSWEGSF